MAESSAKELEVSQTGVLCFGESQLHPSISPRFQLQNEVITQISCGHDHSAILCKSGRVYTFGKNKYGQLGLDLSKEKVTRPTVVMDLCSIPITQVACGCHFTFFLAASGRLLSCGRNRRGQLGQGQMTETNCSVPRPTSNKSPFKKVSAGMCHAVFLTVDGTVFVCGSSSQGQMGLGQCTLNAYLFPIPELSSPGPVADVVCGAFHTALLTEEGNLYMTGCNDKGQLGVDSNCGVFRDYMLVPLPAPVAAVACGSSHTVVLVTDGTVWVWGSNVFGQQGTGNDANNLVPVQIVTLENLTFTKVFAGENNLALLTDDGDVLLCGCGKQGQLDTEKEDLRELTPMKKLPELVVTQVAFASTYALMLVLPNPEVEPS